MLLSSRWSRSWFCLNLVALSSLAVAQQAQVSPQQGPAALTLLTERLPKAVLRSRYNFELKAQGGTEPRQWKIAEGALPPGLELSPSGMLSGTPTATGEYRFRALVADSSSRPQKQARWLVLRVVAPLTIGWKRPPQRRDDQILGAVEVSNATDDDFDLTVIVVAVNEVGKAFAVGYQNFTLSHQTANLQIEFGSSLPRGAYIVHADAVAEIAEKNLIHRSRLQTPEALRVP